MAKLKLRILTLDGLPKELQAFYRPMEGGGFILDHDPDPDGYGIDNLASIRGKLDEKARDYERANQRLQSFKKPDGSLFSVEEIQSIMAQAAKDAELIATLKDKSKTGDEKLQQMVSDATKPLHAEIAKHKQAVERYRTSSHKAEKQRVIQKALDVLKPQDRWRNLIARELESQIEIREAEDGTISHVIVHPETGRPRMSSLQGRDGPMDIAEFAGGADLRKTFGDCLQGDNKKGADITGNQDPGQKGGGNTPSGLVLPPNANQAQFEAAMKQAREKGLEVSFADSGEAAQGV
jgi:hypothetical protein